jgi:hypothetical protein
MTNLAWFASTVGRRGRIVAAIVAGTVSCVERVSAAPIQSETATVVGVVRDASDAPLQNALVTITRLDTGISRPVVPSSAEGRFQFLALFPSRYRISIVLQGFATATRDIALSVDENLALAFKLSLARTTEAVTVVATESPLVDPSKTSLGRTITSRQLDDVPLPSGVRSSATLAMLTPGILSDVAKQGDPTFATAGQINANTLLINGVSTDGAEAFVVPQDAIQEFKVVSNHPSAEFGQASGAVVNVLIRSGTNRPHGRALWLQQEGALNARSATSRLAGAPDPGLSQQQFGLSWGGPIAPNRAFLFASAEQTLKHTNYTNTSPVAALFRPDDPLTIPYEARLPRALFRGDVNLSAGNALTLQYIFQNIFTANAGREIQSAIERSLVQDSPIHDVTVGDTHIIGSRAVHNLKVHWNRARSAFSVDGRCEGCASLTYPDIKLGKPPLAPSAELAERVDLVDTLSWLVNGRGHHDLTAGFDLAYMQLSNSNFANQTGTYQFKLNLPFDESNALSYPNKFTQNTGNPGFTARQTIASFFLQDGWQPRDGVAIDLGVRWDHTQRPESGVQNDVGPRLGASFDPWRRGTTVFRGGLGRYYDEDGLRAIRTAGTGFVSMTIAKPGFQGSLLNFDPFGPNPSRGAAPAVPQYSLYTTAATIAPYTDQASLGFQKQLGTRMAVTVDAVRARGYLLPVGWDLNHADAAGVRPNPDKSLKQIIATKSLAQSWYTGLQVGAERRMTTRYGYTLAYTWSTSENNVDGPRAIPSDQTNLMADRGPTPLDIRHSLTGTVTVIAPLGFRVSTIVFARTGLPYNIITGTDDDDDGEVDDRPFGVSRNSARGPGLFEADVRVSKVLPFGRNRIEILIDVFNITNHDNWTDYQGAQNALKYLQPTNAGLPRQIQFGVRFDFGSARK